MDKVIKVTLPDLHPGQLFVRANSKRFNVLRNGRRWGKTVFGVDLAAETVLNGQHVGCFFPTYEFSEDFWDELKDRLEEIIEYKSESKKMIKK